MSHYLLLLTFSRFATSTAMMIYAGSLPFLLAEWQMTGAEAGAIQSVFNICYAVSLLTTSWLSDHVGAKRVYLFSTAFSLVAFLAFAHSARSYESALILYGIVGLTLGGSYGPVLMLVADKAPPSSRGRAMGAVLSGASLGYCSAIALAAAIIPILGYQTAWWIVAGILTAGLLSSFAALAGEPNQIHRKKPLEESDLSFWKSLTSRKSALLTAGYTAHCWELLGMWAWAPAFLMLSLSAQIAWPEAALGVVVAVVLHLTGAASTLFAGGLSDRFGRRAVLISMALAGALLSMIFGWSADWGPIILLLLAAAYGFATIGDSGVLTAAMTESVSPRHLGGILALRSMLGFGAGALSPLAFGFVLDLADDGVGAPDGWGWAFVVLGIGGMLATVSATLLPNDSRKKAA